VQPHRTRYAHAHRTRARYSRARVRVVSAGGSFHSGLSRGRWPVSCARIRGVQAGHNTCTYEPTPSPSRHPLWPLLHLYLRCLSRTDPSSRSLSLSGLVGASAGRPAPLSRRSHSHAWNADGIRLRLCGLVAASTSARTRACTSAHMRTHACAH